MSTARPRSVKKGMLCENEMNESTAFNETDTNQFAVVINWLL